MVAVYPAVAVATAVAKAASRAAVVAAVRVVVVMAAMVAAPEAAMEGAAPVAVTVEAARAPQRSRRRRLVWWCSRLSLPAATRGLQAWPLEVSVWTPELASRPLHQSTGGAR